MSIFSSGVTALQASQRAIETIGNNVANANTPGYHRQILTLAPSLATQQGGLLIGRGVTASHIVRVRSEVLERSLLRNKSDVGDTSARTRGLRLVETALSPGSGGINTHLDQLFNQFEELELTGRLSDVPLRGTVIGGAVGFTSELNTLANRLNVTRNDVGAEIQQAVDDINVRLRQVAALNAQIRRSEGIGESANSVRDQRDQVIAEIAERIDVEIVEQEAGQSVLLVGGAPAVVGDTSTPLQALVNSTSGLMEIKFTSTGGAFGVAGGQLKGQLDLYNTSLPDAQSRLEVYTHELMRSLDSVHSKGVGLSGGFTTLDSKRRVNNPAALLNNAGLAFPPQAGVLTVGVTNIATGQRTISRLAIDPATQSLNDVVTALNGVANISAVSNSQTGTLAIQASNGYRFDFTGGYSSNPAGPGFTGTAIPTLGGPYQGAADDNFTFTVNGSGTVGVTPGLELVVTDQAANVIGTFNIGQGYSPGATLNVKDGVTVKLATGTVVTGESFSSDVVADADSSSLLGALGLNTLFTGDDASTIQVNKDLVDDPRRLAASATRETNDGTNLRRLIDTRTSPTLNSGAQSFSDYFNNLVSDVGREVYESSQLEESHVGIGEKIFAEREALSGVDPNEEFVNLVQYQKMFEMASQYISVVNRSLDALLSII